MAPGPQRWRRFASARALRLHLTLAVLLPAFAVLFRWQLGRALGGNTLSWAYAVEWPLFAGYAVFLWWRLLHDDLPSRPRRYRGPRAAARAAAREAKEAAELKAYNAYLADLASSDLASPDGGGSVGGGSDGGRATPPAGASAEVVEAAGGPAPGAGAPLSDG